MTACRTEPERTLYLAFGHDEEVGGDLGAGAMAALLASRGVTLDFIVDEGGPILVDGLPSLLRTPTQIALVGTAEKVSPCLSLKKVQGARMHYCTKPYSYVWNVVTRVRSMHEQTPPSCLCCQRSVVSLHQVSRSLTAFIVCQGMALFVIAVHDTVWPVSSPMLCRPST